MAQAGINAVRIPHTMPPRSLLDAAHRHGLWVMVGLSAEQYLGYVIDRRSDVDPERVLRDRVSRCAGHPALLSYSLGNEIPAHVARWYGRSPVERYLERLYRAVKDEDPEGLVTYVNYPSTEYLELPFLDLVCYNVYLERQADLEAYLARLQNIAADRPLILSEIGLDALRNGQLAQARSLDRRVAPGGGGGRRLGLRHHGPRAPAQAGPRRRPHRLHRGALPRPAVAAHLGRRMLVQRVADDPRLP